MAYLRSTPHPGFQSPPGLLTFICHWNPGWGVDPRHPSISRKTQSPPGQLPSLDGTQVTHLPTVHLESSNLDALQGPRRRQTHTTDVCLSKVLLINATPKKNKDFMVKPSHFKIYWKCVCVCITRFVICIYLSVCESIWHMHVESRSSMNICEKKSFSNHAWFTAITSLLL